MSLSLPIVFAFTAHVRLRFGSADAYRVQCCLVITEVSDSRAPLPQTATVACLFSQPLPSVTPPQPQASMQPQQHTPLTQTLASTPAPAQARRASLLVTNLSWIYLGIQASWRVPIKEIRTINECQHPINAPSCRFQCARIAILKRHAKKHAPPDHPLNKRPFVCEHDGCAFRSSQKVDLIKHIRCHTGEKPYECHECSYRASRKANLRRHIQVCANRCIPFYTSCHAIII